MAMMVIIFMAIIVTTMHMQTVQRALNQNSISVVGNLFPIILFIFVITQIVSMWAGYKYSFAGRESKEAYATTDGISSYIDYMKSHGQAGDLDKLL
jgi:amino acid transporter